MNPTLAIPRSNLSLPLLFGGTVWLAVIAMGFSVLGREEFTPVHATVVASDFPQGSSIRLATDRPTLIVFAHPQCPCTRATLSELDRLIAATSKQVSTFVVFTLPDGVPVGWEHGDLWNTASAMPFVQVLRDPGGVEAKRFHVAGSGHALLYAATGRLLFSGGITASRGHEGDNAGLSAIESLVRFGRADVRSTPVFGCSLL